MSVGDSGSCPGDCVHASLTKDLMCGVLGEGCMFLSEWSGSTPAPVATVIQNRDQLSIRIDTSLNIIEETCSPWPLIQMNRLSANPFEL